MAGTLANCRRGLLSSALSVGVTLAGVTGGEPGMEIQRIDDQHVRVIFTTDTESDLAMVACYQASIYEQRTNRRQNLRNLADWLWSHHQRDLAPVVLPADSQELLESALWSVAAPLTHVALSDEMRTLAETMGDTFAKMADLWSVYDVAVSK